MTAQYPKRPQFFAVKFTRLMGKVCLGGDIGPEACWLLSFIVSTEDAAGYRRSVSFYNEDLATRCGFSLAAMKRARERAVAAGWLIYTPGAKRRPARYHVTIPAYAGGLDDAPGDEGGNWIPAQSEPESEPVSEPVSGIPAQSEPESEPRSGRNASHPLPIPIPNTNTSPSESGTADAAPAAPGKSESDPAKTKPTRPKKPRKPPSGPHHEAVRAFCDQWATKYGAKYTFGGGKDATSVAWMLKQVDGDVEKFAAVVRRYLADADHFYADDHHPIGKLRSNFPRWFVPGPAPPKPYRPPANAAVERAMRGDVAPPMSLTVPKRQVPEPARA